MQQIMTVNSLAYKVQTERAILVFPDSAQKHAQYDEQVLQTFYVSNADVTELTQLLTSLVRLPTLPVQPTIQFNKTANTITVRAPASIVQIIGRIIDQNDKARAEIMFDIEILEVNRTRAKQYGLNLSEYAIGAILSPEVSPSGTTISGGTGTTPGGGTTTTVTAGKSTPPSGVQSPPPFNLNTISKGFTTSDFYLAVPTAIVRFLESDTQTKLVAKPQIRSAEGNKTSLNLGDEVPIVTTSYTPIATGGAGVNPLNSFQLKPVGINIDITPVRVTLEGDIVIDLSLESSSRGSDVNIAGTNYPSFGSRKVVTRLRLRDGESNLLAGLLREDERKSLNGVPGAIRVPILKQLFSNNDQTIAQTDIVMLLTPHIVRAPEITESDLKPLYIGTQNSLGIGGPPPLIAGPEPADNAGGVGGQPLPPPPPVMQVPPGSSPVPGFVVTPAPPEPVAAAATTRRSSGRPASRRGAAAADHESERRAGDKRRNRPGANSRHAAGHAVPRRGRAVQRSDHDHQRLPDLGRDRRLDLRSRAPSTANGDRRRLHAVGRVQRHLQQSDWQRAHRHRHHSRGRLDGRDRHRLARGGDVRRDRAWNIDDWLEWHRDRTWRDGDGARVQARDGHHSTVVEARMGNVRVRTSRRLEPRATVASG